MDFLVGAATVICYLFIGLMIHKILQRIEEGGHVMTCLIAWPLVIVLVVVLTILSGLEAIAEYFFDHK